MAQWALNNGMVPNGMVPDGASMSPPLSPAFSPAPAYSPAPLASAPYVS